MIDVTSRVDDSTCSFCPVIQAFGNESLSLKNSDCPHSTSVEAVILHVYVNHNDCVPVKHEIQHYLSVTYYCAELQTRLAVPRGGIKRRAYHQKFEDVRQIQKIEAKICCVLDNS